MATLITLIITVVCIIGQGPTNEMAMESKTKYGALQKGGTSGIMSYTYPFCS